LKQLVKIFRRKGDEFRAKFDGSRVKLVQLVATKIQGGQKELASTVAVAILGVLIPLNVNPAYEVASELVASNMRYCSGISDNRKLVFSLQHPETVQTFLGIQIFIKLFGSNSQKFGRKDRTIRQI
jgi:hypothetical protein